MLCLILTKIIVVALSDVTTLRVIDLSHSETLVKNVLGLLIGMRPKVSDRCVYQGSANFEKLKRLCFLRKKRVLMEHINETCLEINSFVNLFN